MLNVDGYYVCNDLRIDKNSDNLGRGIGGGLLVFVRNDVIIEAHDNASVFNQYCSFSICDHSNKNPLNFVLFYRSPNSSIENNQLLVDVVNRSPKNVFIIGDANYPKFNDFENFSGQPAAADDINQAKSRSGYYLANAAHEKFLEQIINFPTHVKGNILDICLTDRPDRVISCEDIGNLANSDHSVIRLEIDFCPKFNKSVQKVRDWRRGDNEGLTAHLSGIDFESLFQDKDVNGAWEALKEVTEAALNRYIPLVDRRKLGDPPWMTRSVKRLVRKKRRKWKLYASDRSVENLNSFKSAEKECKKAVQSAKRRFEKNLASHRNKRAFSSYVKRKTKSRDNVGPLKVNGRVLTDNKCMADELNKFFASVFTADSPPFDNTLTPKECDHSLANVVISSATVLKKLVNLKEGSAPGPDGIGARFLKAQSRVLAAPLASIFNKSLEEGKVPSDWRKANVTPIFKKGGKGDPGNYRPVSLTSIPCKVMESCLRDEIVDHLLRNELISNSQHGFMKNKSVTTNMLEFLEILTSEMDNGNNMDVIYLDFAKAFDKVPHDLLIEQLRLHRVEGGLLDWIKDWLTGRTQRTVLNGEASDWAPVGSGVPQGSVLGPLAFLVFINDIDICASLVNVIKKFADDTKVGHRIVSQEDVHDLQRCLDNLCEWADKWGMTFNVKKCKVMHIGRSNSWAVYTMKGTAIESTDTERDIGIIVHNSLKPTKQCAEASRIAQAVLGQIARAFHFRNRTFVNLYKQYVRPHLEFSVPAWSPWTAADREVLEQVQRRMVRMVSGLRGNSYEARLEELGLLSLETRRVKYDLVQTYKIVHGLDQVDSSTWFQLVGNDPPRVTRETSDPLNIVRKEGRLEIRRKFYSNRVVEHWNALESDIKSARSIATFKSGIQQYLINLDARRQ